MRCANFYPPSRGAIFTGKSPAQLHMTFVGEGRKESGGNLNGRVIASDCSIELPTNETTIAELTG